MIATATPTDLRAAPETAGRPAEGTDIRILDADRREVATGDVGTDLRAQLDAVRRLYLGRHQGLPRRLHVAAGTSGTSTRRAAVRGGPR